MFKTFIVFLGLTVSPAIWAQDAPVPEEPYRRTVHLEFKAPEAKTAFLCGNMTNWECDKVPMRRTGAGVFYINAQLQPGRIEYVFVADGKPRLDEASQWEDDGKGGKRSFFVLDDDREAQAQEGIPHGRIEQRQLKSQALGQERSINVYTPAGYSTTNTYPVLFLLHGYGMDQEQWLNGGVQHVVDRLIASRLLSPVIMVMPGAPDEFYMGRSERFIVEDVYPFIAREYRIRTGRAAAAIAGTSMGGFGAFYLSYRHPELFGHALLLSPASRDDRFLARLDRELKAGARVSAAQDIYCGLGDEIAYPYTERLVKILGENKVAYSYAAARGVHDWDYWRSVLKPALLKIQAFFDKGR